MDPLYIQNLRYKLQKRISRLNSVSDASLFSITLTQFWRFFDNQSTFRGIIEELLLKFPNLEEDVKKILDDNQGLYGDTEEEAAAIGYKVLRQLPGSTEKILDIGFSYRQCGKMHEAIEAIREIFVEPFYEYVDENLDEQRAIISLLIKYKHRCEWFQRDRLWELGRIGQGGEKALALDLYAYLHDQGIDFIIEPSSITGEVDLISAQNTEDPILLDAKVFDGEDRGKYYIKKGFNQIYTYTQQFNEPFGYLVIYKLSENDILFSLKSSQFLPSITYNNKTIFFITIDIYPHAKPVSQRGLLRATEITENDLISVAEEEIK